MSELNQVRSSNTPFINNQIVGKNAQRKDLTLTPSTAPKKNDDAIHLSQDGKEVLGMHKGMLNTPGLNTQKVLAIKNAIADGSYTIDPHKIVNKMVADAPINAGL